MFSQVQEAVDCLGAALDGVGAASTGELRRTLGLAKQLRSRVELLETRAAAAVAQRERHGDGGAGLLNQVGGRSRSDAARNVRAEAELAGLAEARAAVGEGEMSLANAARLAQVARKTSPDAVRGDADLVEMAKTLPADEFAQAAQRWTVRHQRAEDLAAQHRRNRRNRGVRFWNGEDGSVQMRGSFDVEMGARIQQRLRRQAELLRQADRRRQRHERSHQHSSGPGDAASSGGASGDAASSAAGSGDDTVRDHAVPGGAARTRDQRMADALDTLLAAGIPAWPPAPVASPDAVGTPASGSAHTPTRSAEPADARDSCGTDGEHGAQSDVDAGPAPDITHALTRPTEPAGRKAAEIIVRADLAALVGEAGGIAEVCGAGPIPPSALQRLACNSDVWFEIFGDELTPLYETVASRAPTAAQRRALIARDGACIGCGEPPGECEAHHVTPCQRGGKTRLDNLVLVCWCCHDLIHDHNWQVTARRGRHGLAPPDPAHPAEPAPQRKPAHRPPQIEPERRATPPEAERGSPQQAPAAARPPPIPTTTGSSPAPPADRPLWDDPAA